jgi:hypothetical protein
MCGKKAISYEPSQYNETGPSKGQCNETFANSPINYTVGGQMEFKQIFILLETGQIRANFIDLAYYESTPRVHSLILFPNRQNTLNILSIIE